MATENAQPFTEALSHISEMVQAEAEGRPVSTTSPEAKQADPATPAATPEIPTPAAPTAPKEGLYLGQYKTEDEAIKARHVLIHSLNAAKAKADKLEAENLALRSVVPSPLSPGRVDPAHPERAEVDDEKWRTTYGIDPADIDARVERRVQDALKAHDAPVVAKQAADAYILGSYPDFPVKAKEIELFVTTNDTLRDRVGQLWQQGLFAEAMEISYLVYDNALRTVQAAEAVNTDTQGKVDASRGDATMLSSQAGGPRDIAPDNSAYPRTPEDWKRIREMQAAGRDVEVNRILYGHLIKDIPVFNQSG